MFETLARETADPPGFTRAAYGPGEQFAHDLVANEAKSLGCDVSTDAAGNLFATWRGEDGARPCLMIGSHVDTVPHGGAYDGAAGVIAGLALLAELSAAGQRFPADITVAAFRAEEAAWFPLSYPGSEAAIGRLSPLKLEARRSDTGRTLADHMTLSGFDPQAVASGRSNYTPDDIATYLEVHIEQGPVLLEKNYPVGVVTSMYGGFRHMAIEVVGRWAHSGATPHGYRADAVVAFADLVGRLNRRWADWVANGHELVITFGKVETDPALHGGSRVAGKLTASLDVRAATQGTLTEVANALALELKAVSDRHGVMVTCDEPFTWPTAGMDDQVIEGVSAAVMAEGLALLQMPSGAGHDAATFAKAGVPSGMLFVRNANGSHNPDEAMDMPDLDCAVGVLSGFVHARRW